MQEPSHFFSPKTADGYKPQSLNQWDLNNLEEGLSEMNIESSEDNSSDCHTARLAVDRGHPRHSLPANHRTQPMRANFIKAEDQRESPRWGGEITLCPLEDEIFIPDKK